MPSVSEVADRLGLSRQRVLELISSEELPARKIGRQWVVEEPDIAGWGQRRGSVGRPMAPAVAWGLIALLQGRDPDWLSPSERSRLRSRLRRQPSVDAVGNWVRKRSELHWLAGHRSALPKILDVPDALPTGVSAPGHDVIVINRTEIYLPGERFADLVSELLLDPSNPYAANILIRVPNGLWPFDNEVGAVAVAMDLWEAGDDRSRRAASLVYKKALRSWVNS